MKTRLLISLGLLATASTVFASPYTVGDVFASVGGGLVREYTPTGTLVQTLDTGTGSAYTTGGVFDGSGNFYVTSFDAGVVSTFASGSTSGSFFASVGGDQESITRNMTSSAFFVGQADGAGDLTELDAAGALVNTFHTTTGPRGTDWVDLAADQTTIYYTSEGGTVYRYSTVGAGSQLTNFTTNGGTMYAFRILADGGVLASNTSNVLRFDNTGAVVQTYAIPNASLLFALNLDPDGVTAWTGDLDNSNVTRFNIATGDIVTQWNAGGTLAGLTVFGEITQGGGGGGAVPEPSSLLLLGTGVILAFVNRKKLSRLR
jgi:PEP-CTERM motif